MKQLLMLFLAIVIVRDANGFLPVAASAAEKASDSAVLVSSISSLAEEIGISSELAEELIAIKKEAELLRDQIELTNSVTEEVFGLTKPNFNESKKISYNIDSVTRYVKRVKSLGSLIVRIGARPEASTAASLMETNNLLSKMLQSQERDNMARERAELAQERKDLAERIAIAKFLDSEMKTINEHAEAVSHRRRRSLSKDRSL